MKVSVQNITPQLASQWLTLNTSNRPLRRQIVQNWKDIFARGEYKVTHQGIAISASNVLLDGQHRLTAISEMPDNFSIKMLVAEDLGDDTFDALDQGFRRTTSDVLKENSRLVEVGRFLAIVYHGRPNGITPQFVKPFVEFARPHHDALMDFCPTVAKVFGACSFRSAAVVLLASGVDQDYVKATYRAMVLADFAAMPASAQVLYRSFLSGGLRASASVDAFCRALKVMSPEFANLKQIKVIDPSVITDRVRLMLQGSVVGAAKKKAEAQAPAKKAINSPNYRLFGG